MAGRLVTFPRRGAYRVHRDPTKLVRRTRPRHRFDDPENEYFVWYFATTLRGALTEVLDHFRAVRTAEEKAAAIKNVEGLDILDANVGEEHAGAVPAKVLDELRVVRARIEPNPGPKVLNLVDEDLLAEMNLSARIREVLEAGGIKIFGPGPTLNFGNVQSAGRFARQLTQAVGRVIYEDERSPIGIRYTSRHTEDEECWAIFDSEGRSSPVRFGDVEYLDPTKAHHRGAVQETARLLRLSLPPGWHS